MKWDKTLTQTDNFGYSAFKESMVFISSIGESYTLAPLVHETLNIHIFTAVVKVCNSERADI